MRNNGFTLLEVMVAVAVFGVVTTIAVPVYQGHITKTQVTEAFATMEGHKTQLADSISRSGKCEFGDSKTVVDKYGTLTASGTLIANSLNNPKKVLKTGCVLTFTFNNTGATKHITGKTVVADLMSNSSLSKNATGTVIDNFLPKAFKVVSPDTAGTLAAVPGAPSMIPPPTYTKIPEVSEIANSGIVELQPSESVDVVLVGGGGGGGGAVHNYSSSQWWVDVTGGNGGDTSVTISPLGSTLTAGGGKGGGQAHWGNGSSYTNGAGGLGGVYTMTGNTSVFSNVVGVNGIRPPTVVRWQRQLGGTTVAPTVPEGKRGAGGNGAWGVGDEQWSYGGGGGSGAMVSAKITNTTSNVMKLTFNVGSGGSGWQKTSVTNGNNSDPGEKGYAKVTAYR